MRDDSAGFNARLYLEQLEVPGLELEADHSALAPGQVGEVQSAVAEVAAAIDDHIPGLNAHGWRTGTAVLLKLEGVQNRSDEGPQAHRVADSREVVVVGEPAEDT